MNNLIPIVYGEPRSINCEIIAKTWKKLKLKKQKRIFLIGNYNIIQNQIRKHKINLKLLKISKLNDFTQYKKKSNTIKVLDIPNKDKLLINSINKAHNLAEKKKIKGCFWNNRLLRNIVR